MKLLTALRDATADAHQALHVHPVLRDLVTPRLTQDYYLAVLSGFYGFYAGIEPYLAKSGHPDLREFSPARATSDLASDLTRLSHKPENLSVYAPETVEFDLARAVGFLYLREGSTLGGQQISKNLLKVLGLRPGVENRFFQGYGAETGAKWKAFQQKLLDLEDHVDHDAASESAFEFFTALDRWLYRERQTWVSPVSA
jgi:heme oxygenase (biliverdin-IX-beta and delta-forming)